ncbi:hypothetical protein ACH4E7_13475 [Kitasatospora sp. NPDC018058]|uniref:hypothetical protein n=1 Tax=Kitasatospora sp. NPDC018058 TaxID=3364025 RepID=UPI0037BEA33D
MSFSPDFVPPAARHRGLQVDSDGRRYDVSPVVEVKPDEGAPVPSLDFWPDCACPRHRDD